MKPRLTKSYGGQRMYEILDAFLTPELRQRVLLNESDRGIYQNHWLVRKSAAVAFSQGYFHLSFSREVKVSCPAGGLDCSMTLPSLD